MVLFPLIEGQRDVISMEELVSAAITRESIYCSLSAARDVRFESKLRGIKKDTSN